MNLRAAVTLACIATGFFVAVTPWTLVQIAQSFDVPVNSQLQFASSWMAISNSFWNAIIYGMCNRAFRRIAKTMITTVCGTLSSPCAGLAFDDITNMSAPSSNNRIKVVRTFSCNTNRHLPVNSAPI